MIQILTALVEMHSTGLIHRDLKPSNILINKKDGNLDVVVSDFG